MIVKMIEASGAPQRAKARSIAAIEHLDRAEAAVHQVPIGNVHFHEAGAADSIADIVGISVALSCWTYTRLSCPPFNVAAGILETEHGMPLVPTPPTALLLQDKPIYTSGPSVDLTPPAGAALACLASSYGPMPPMTVRKSGYGAGDRDSTEQANVLRVLVGDAHPENDPKEAQE